MLMLMLEQMTDQAQGCHAIDLRELKAAMRSLGFEVKNEELKMMMAMATASPRFSL
jgi:Ca2+-binding EF-hand superfamily protein